MLLLLGALPTILFIFLAGIEREIVLRAAESILLAGFLKGQQPPQSGVFKENLFPFGQGERKGRIMKRKLHSLFVLVIFSVVVFHCPLIFAASETLAKTPLKIVVVSGTNYEMGVQYGKQAGDLIATNVDVTWELLDQLGHDMVLNDIKVWTYYLEKYDPKLKDWLLGISDGCKNKGFEVSYVDLVALMVLPQELWARPAGEYPVETGVTAFMPTKSSINLAKERINTRAMASCTAFAATGDATGNEPMVTLTLGFISDIKLYVIIFAYPNEGEPFVALTMAGKVSNNTGMNSHFAWIMTAAVTHPFMPCASSWGVPSEVYHHYLQQYCSSPAEAMEYLDSTPKGGVTGIFLFADKSGDVFAYEVGSCASEIRYPGDLGETDFVATTNHYNSETMKPFAIPAEWFGDTYIRYATIYKRLYDAEIGTIDLNFAKACWLSNEWYDEVNDEWNTVPVPNDPDDFNTCNVPGNNCEGGESQVVQFPKQKTVFLQSGGPHGTSIKYYWPDDPKPTGEYTKWQLKDSIHDMAEAASDDTLQLIEIAMDSFKDKGNALDRDTRQSLHLLLVRAQQAWRKAEGMVVSAEQIGGPKGKNHKVKMARWGEAATNYATAQLYSQMVTTTLNRLVE